MWSPPKETRYPANGPQLMPSFAQVGVMLDRPNDGSSVATIEGPSLLGPPPRCGDCRDRHHPHISCERQRRERRERLAALLVRDPPLVSRSGGKLTIGGHACDVVSYAIKTQLGHECPDCGWSREHGHKTGCRRGSHDGVKHIDRDCAEVNCLAAGTDEFEMPGGLRVAVCGFCFARMERNRDELISKSGAAVAPIAGCESVIPRRALDRMRGTESTIPGATMRGGREPDPSATSVGYDGQWGAEFER